MEEEVKKATRIGDIPAKVLKVNINTFILYLKDLAILLNDCRLEIIVLFPR